MSDHRTTPSHSQAAKISLAEHSLSDSRGPEPGGDRRALSLQEVLNTHPRRWHGLLGGADVREGGDDGLDVRWQGREHRVVEGEGEDAWEGGAVTTLYAGGCQVFSHVELPEEVNAQDGPLHIPYYVVELALVQG